MVVSWINLLLFAGVLASVTGDCPPAHITDYIAYPMQFGISNEIVYDIFNGTNEYKEEFRRYFKLNHSLVSSEDSDRIKNCLSYNKLTLLNMNGSLFIDDKFITFSNRSLDSGPPVYENTTFEVHRSLPLLFKYAGDDSKWHTSKEAALEMIVCGNGHRANSSVVAYTKVTIPEEGEYGAIGGDHHHDPFDPNPAFTHDRECCRLEVKLAFALLQAFIGEKPPDSHWWFWLIVVPLALIVTVAFFAVLGIWFKRDNGQHGRVAAQHEENVALQDR